MKPGITREQPGLFEALDPETASEPRPILRSSGTGHPEDTPGLAPLDSDEQARLEQLVRELEDTGRYKVLRRFEERLDEPSAVLSTTGLRKGVYLDVETTGLMPSDRIIELAMLTFHFDDDGNVVAVSDAFDEFEDPQRKIPADIVSLTGITNEMVAGRRIQDADVARVLEGADIVVAHNAGFDRQFVETRFPFFSEFAWACSVNDVDWSTGGHRSRKLENLALAKGYFYQAHRAIYDCHVAVGLLSMPIGDSGPPALADLLLKSSGDTVRLWAEASPFEKKDDLKGRSYRWSAQAKVWWRDLPADLHAEELEWLAANVYPRRRPLPFLRFSATTRYSRRLPESPPPDAARE